MRKNNQGGKPENDETNNTDFAAENQPSPGQLIPEKGEEYLREVANIEDMPSPKEDKEADNVLRDEENRDQLRSK